KFQVLGTYGTRKRFLGPGLGCLARNGIAIAIFLMGLRCGSSSSVPTAYLPASVSPQFTLAGFFCADVGSEASFYTDPFQYLIGPRMILDQGAMRRGCV